MHTSLLFKPRLVGQDTLESILEIIHDLLVVLDTLVVIQAHQTVGLLGDSLNCLTGTDEEGEHLGVGIGIVGLEITTADLPGTKQFGGIVGQCPELVNGSLGEFLFCHTPYLFKGRLEIRLGIMRSTQGDELAVWTKQMVHECLGAVTLVEPLVLMLLHYLPLAEMTIDDADVVLDPDIPL